MRTHTEGTGPLPSRNDLAQPLRGLRGDVLEVKPPPRRIWFVLGCALVAVLGIAAGVFAGLPGLVERAGTRAFTQLEDRFGLRVDAREVSWTWSGSVVAKGVVVRSDRSDEVIATIEAIAIDSEVDLWSRHVRVVRVALDKPVVKFTRDAAGHSNLDGLIAALTATKTGAGGGRGVSIAPEVPLVVMDDATIAVDAVLPPLPLGLALPGRATFEHGKVTIRPTGPAPDGRIAETPVRLEVAFASTSLDPGQGLSLLAEGPLTGTPERVEVTPARPMRFWLGERVLGIGGVALTNDGIELGPLQLSVPTAKNDAPQVEAAATCAKIIVGPGPRELIARAAAAMASGKGLPGLLAAVDRVVLMKPVVSLNVDAKGRHDYADLLPLIAIQEANLPVASNALELVRVITDANVVASERLLRAKSKNGDPIVRPLWERAVVPFAGLAATSRRRVPKLVRVLESLPFKSLEVVDGEVLLGLPNVRATVTGLTLTATHEGAMRELKATAKSIDIGTADKPTLELVARLADEKLHAEVKATTLPMALFEALGITPGASSEGAPQGTASIGFLPVGTLVELELAFDGDVAGGAWDLVAKAALKGGGFNHPSVAARPLTELEVQAQGAVHWDGVAGTLSIVDAVVQSRGVVVRGGLDVADALHKPKLRIQAELAETPLQRIVDAIPTGFAPQLEGLRMDGTLRWPVTVDLDTAAPEDVRIDSRPDARGLQVLTMGAKVDFNALRGQYAYTIRLADGSSGQRMVGPMTGSWVPLGGITPYLPLALTTTEDGTFYSNDGISTRAMQESIATNLARGSFVRGASTLTQQLVKNLFLSGNKTISRKLQEVFIAWQMAQQMSKDEVMALYLNAIEFGPGIYGIGDAAWHWFGKRPIDLTLTEAIFLASIIPGPRKYYSFFSQGGVTPRWQSYLGALLKVMVDRGKITEQELIAAAPYAPRFRGAGGGYGDTPPEGFDELPEGDNLPDE